MSSTSDHPDPSPADDGIHPGDPASQVRTSGSSDVSSASQKSRKAKLAKLKVQQQTMRKEADLLLQQQQLEFRVAEVRLEGEIAAAEAEDQVYDEGEAVAGDLGNIADEAVPGMLQQVAEKDPSHQGHIQAVGRTHSEVSFRTPGQRRLPEVPARLPSTIPVYPTVGARQSATNQSVVLLSAAGRRRLPEVPTGSRQGSMISIRSPVRAEVRHRERSQEQNELPEVTTKKTAVPGAGSKVRRWGMM